MEKIVLLYTIAACLMFSCKKESLPLSSPEIKPSADSISHRFLNSSIILEKTGCPESCEDYKVVISGNGKALYEARSNTGKLGKFEKQLTPLQINTLFNAYECASFFDFRQVYSGERKDSSYILLTFNHRGWEKTIKEEAEAPEELNKLQEMVEAIRKEENWIKVE